jgi:hypothetical protein
MSHVFFLLSQMTGSQVKGGTSVVSSLGTLGQSSEVNLGVS